MFIEMPPSSGSWKKMQDACSFLCNDELQFLFHTVSFLTRTFEFVWHFQTWLVPTDARTTHTQTHTHRKMQKHTLAATKRSDLLTWRGGLFWLHRHDTRLNRVCSFLCWGASCPETFSADRGSVCVFVLTRWSTHDRPAQPRLWHGATGRFVSFWNVINREFTRSRDHAARLCGRVPDLQLLKFFANNPDTLTCGALESWLAKWVCFLLIQLKSDSCGDQGGVIQVGELLWSASVLRHSNKNYQSIFYN